MRSCRFLGLALLLFPFASAAAEPIRVTGRILDGERRTSIAGARVELFPAYEESSESTPPSTAEPAPLAFARSGTDGSFEIVAPESGGYRVRVRKEGFAEMEYPFLPLVETMKLPETFLVPEQLLKAHPAMAWRRSEGDDELLGWTFAERKVLKSARVRREPSRRISGKVVDAISGKPVAGALVWSGRPLLAPVARTSAEGNFQISVPAGEENWLQAAAAGFLPGERHDVASGGAGSNILKLVPAVALSGVVVDAADRPVAGVRIMAEKPYMFGSRPEWVTVQSQDNGSFRLAGLRPGEVYEITASREGFSRTKLTVRLPPDRRPSNSIRIVLREGRSAFGHVKNEAGQPVAAAEVTLNSPTEGTSLKATSDHEGKFEFRHLNPGQWNLVARHHGYSFADRPAIEIPSGETAFDLGTLTLPASAFIEGRVTDSKGTGIEDAEVSLEPSAFDTGSMEGLDRDLFFGVPTGPDGSFRLEGLRHGEQYDLFIDHPGYVSTSVPSVKAPTEDPIRIEMKTTRSLAGRVLGPAGEPVPGASLRHVEELRFSGTMSISSGSLGETGADGRFRVSGLPAGSIDIEVSAEGYETRRVEGLQIPEGKDLEGLEITLRQGAVLEVQVLDARGEPAPGVAVNAESEKPPDLATIRFWRPSYAQTDYRGRCRLSVTRHEPYRVTALKDLRSATARLVPDPGSTPVELRLPAGFEISGRVLGSDGEANQSVSVYLEGAEQRSTAMPAAADGAFVFSDIPDGEYHLKAQNNIGKVSAPLEVRVAGGPVRDLELRLDREDERTTLQGHILGLSPNTLRRVSVMASPAGGGPTLRGQIGPEGEYHIERLAPGPWLVQASTAESRTVTETVQIEPGAKTATLDLEFSSGSLTLSGRVLLDGAPLVGAAVAVAKQNGVNMGGVVQTAWDGSFTVGDLEAGTTTLFIFNMSGIGASRSVELTESQEMVIELASGRLRGIVTTEGEPAEDAVVTVEALLQEKASFPAAELHSGPDGAFETPRLVSGSYRIKVEKEGFVPAELTVEIAAGEERMVEIQLAPLVL